MRALAVLLISILEVTCGGHLQESSDIPYVERTYQLKETSIISGDGAILIRLANGNGFWAHIKKFKSTGVNSDLSGTHIWVRGQRRMLDLDEVDLTRVYEVQILVRTDEQREKWDDFLEQQRDIFYGPNDVFPPESGR